MPVEDLALHKLCQGNLCSYLVWLAIFLLSILLISIFILYPFYVISFRRNRERDEKVNNSIFYILKHFHNVVNFMEICFIVNILCFFYCLSTFENFTTLSIIACTIIFISFIIVITVTMMENILLSVLAIYRFLLYFFPATEQFLSSNQKTLSMVVTLSYVILFIVNFVSRMIKIIRIANIFRITGEINYVGTEEMDSFDIISQRAYFALMLILFLSASLYIPMMISIRKLRNLESVKKSQPEKYILYQTLFLVWFRLLYIPVIYLLFASLDQINETLFFVGIILTDMCITHFVIQASYLSCNKKHVESLLNMCLSVQKNIRFFELFVSYEINKIAKAAKPNTSHISRTANPCKDIDCASLGYLVYAFSLILIVSILIFPFYVVPFRRNRLKKESPESTLSYIFQHFYQAVKLMQFLFILNGIGIWYSKSAPLSDFLVILHAIIFISLIILTTITLMQNVILSVASFYKILTLFIPETKKSLSVDVKTLSTYITLSNVIIFLLNFTSKFMKMVSIFSTITASNEATYTDNENKFDELTQRVYFGSFALFFLSTLLYIPVVISWKKLTKLQSVRSNYSEKCILYHTISLLWFRLVSVHRLDTPVEMFFIQLIFPMIYHIFAFKDEFSETRMFLGIVITDSCITHFVIQSSYLACRKNTLVEPNQPGDQYVAN
ncbi:hypothetical protein CRE_08693 [Caenorhabditis remanei]|uniref:Uncharacterized protein n=1 Tax=Caenorhabditis remanei TaxID=31234 RepID=E3LJE2_CAERE|nr:hypothetical protein CRE_08693 [Caenorhabditis remanei]